MRSFIIALSPDVIRMMKLQRKRWVEYVARMGRRGIHMGFSWESQMERDHWEDIDVGGRIILK
jgi:hypothetical protein